LVRDLNESDGGEVGCNAIRLCCQLGLLGYVYNLEREHWKAENLFFRCIPRHSRASKRNLSWRRIIFVEINFKNKKLFLLREILLRRFREPKSDRLRSGAGLEGGPCSNGVSGISVLVIELTVWIKSSINWLSVVSVAQSFSKSLQILKKERQVALKLLILTFGNSSVDRSVK
jgi:hypothetical protein